MLRVLSVALATLVSVAVGVTSPSTASAAAWEISASHPRLVEAASKFQSLRQEIKSGEAASAFAALKRRADELLNGPRLSYKKDDGIRLTSVPQALVERSYTLALTWRLTDDTRYIERLWTDVNDVAAFPDWNPDHFLDTAEITHASAIALDWGYSYWTSARRSTIERAIVDKGLKPSLSVYAAPATSSGPYRYGGNWAVGTNNWNIVSNSGMILGALAVADVNSTVSNDVLSKAVESLRIGVSGFGQSGGYPEGLLYWGYATQNLIPALKSLQLATGSDQGLITPGLRASGNFPLHLTGPTGRVFNFGDSDQASASASNYLALADMADDPVIRNTGVSAPTTGLPAMRLLWLDSASPRTTPTAGGTPLDATFETAGVTTLRSSWADSKATYVALKTGNVVTGHNSIDAGSFMLDMIGETWSEQLGRDDYTLPGYFDQTDTGRWSYYRTRAEGQNTLVVDPFSPYAANTQAAASPPRVASSPDQAFAVADLSALYAGRVTSWSRGVRLFDSRRQVLVQDEVTSPTPREMLWSMHTRATMDIADDGRSAILSENGKRVLARIVSPSDGVFSDLPAAPLPTSPAPTQSVNRDVRKLGISLTPRTGATIAVQFTPLESTADEQSDAAAAVPLEQWSVPATPPALTKITVNGADLPGFRADVSEYRTLADPGAPLPQVAATAGAGMTVRVEQPTSVPGRAQISVTGGDGTVTRYAVVFDPGPVEVVGAWATRTTAGTPMSTVDGNSNTYWSTWTENSITWQLEGNRDIKGADIDWRANSRQLTYFTIQSSADGVAWTTRYEGAYRGPSGTQWVDLNEGPSARFVRLIGRGAGDADPWTAINEIRILAYKRASSASPPAANIVDSATVSGVPASMTRDETATVSVAARRSDGSALPNDAFDARVVSSDEAVASVDSAGGLVAVGVGTATIGAVVTADRVATFVRSRTVSVSDPTRLRVFASADSYVQGGGSAGSNFGSLTNVLVKGSADPAYARLGYFSFDLSGVKGQVESAVLSMSAGVTESSDSTVRLDVKSVSGSWSESGITFNNRPAFGSTVASMNVDRTAGYRAADLTQYVRSQIDSGQRSLSLGVTQDSTPQLVTNIQSKESGNRPYIDFVLKPAALGVASAVATRTVSGSPSATFDGNPETIWSTSGDQSITWTLSAAKPVKSAKINWVANSRKNTKFEVQTSVDGGSWTTQYDGAYAGGSGWQTVVLSAAPSGKYVRLVVHGDPGDPTTTIRDVEFYNYDVTREAPAVPPGVLRNIDVAAVPGLNLGESATLSVTAYSTTDAKISNDQVSYSFRSSDASIASVDTNGVVSALKVGTANVTVTATFNGTVVSDTVSVSVSDPTRLRVFASADSYVQGGGSAGSNFGSLTNVLVKGSADPAYARLGYFSFDLSGVKGQVESAVLSMSAGVTESSDSTVRLDVKSVSGSWSESGITFNNRPAFGSTVASMNVDRTAGYRAADLTQYVRSQIDSGQRSLSLGVTQDSTPQLVTNIQSKESGNRPYIDFVLKPASTP
ncbi:DNRLRE domain-containing protein [Microbacterium sp. ACRRU]|uniref:CBM96 family carbohydrate-binding protein n=1 Tax=Microbacterium sp. ACRRU TaxID=2918204 RepID=UPI001EF613EC|nr:DNRLRE domain-containing protein [Microbacterium sp. ACRRU]MCG7418034.1 DNRLRE domain-containing protein [Microbacterium sp. ACRRU]